MKEKQFDQNYIEAQKLKWGISVIILSTSIDKTQTKPCLSFDYEDSPPLIVNVANSYSATVNPALL